MLLFPRVMLGLALMAVTITAVWSHALVSCTLLPTLVSPDEFRQVLHSPLSSAYFEGMGACDLMSRSCQDPQEARFRVAQAQMQAPDPGRLFSLAHRADMLCLGNPTPVLAVLSELPWRFVILHDGIEGGMPHTHCDVVCLPLSFFSNSDHQCVRTLIHEKIHVCQRSRPDLCERHLSSDGYEQVCLKSELSPDILRRARANPDLDLYIYRRTGQRGATIFQLSENPSSVSDGHMVSLDWGETDEFEHPYERMAHTLSESIV